MSRASGTEIFSIEKCKGYRSVTLLAAPFFIFGGFGLIIGTVLIISLQAAGFLLVILSAGTILVGYVGERIAIAILLCRDILITMHLNEIAKSEGDGRDSRGPPPASPEHDQ